MRRRWPIVFVIFLFVVAAIAQTFNLYSARMVSSLFFDDNIGQHFFYWGIYYPNLMWFVFPGGFLILGTIFLIQRRKHTQSKRWLQRTLIFTGITTLLILIYGFWGSGIIAEAPFPRHLASVQFDEKTYYLGAIYFLAGDRYVLYQCDNFGLVCSAVYIRESWSMEDTEVNSIEFAIIGSPRPEILQLIINGELEYTINHASSTP